MSQKSPLKFVFVGAFRHSAKDGAVGGQLYACRTLIQSPLSEYVDWVTVDTMMETLPPPPLRRRLQLALNRLWTFIWTIGQREIDGTLIFTSAHLSFVEKGMMAVIAKMWRKRVVFCPRSGLILDDLHKSKFMRWFVPFVLRRSDVVLCQGQSWKQIYQSVSGLPDERFKVVPNWLDAQPFAQVGASRFPQNERMVVLYMGWLKHYKGIYDLIEAVQKNASQLSDCLFIVAGQGSELGPAQRKVEEVGLSSLFEFRGWLTGDDKLAAMCEADVFVLPSHREGMPNVVLEAMAAGLAVIATRVGGVPEILVEPSVGLLVDAQDSEAIGQVLVELNSDPQRRYELGQSGRKHVLAHHDIVQAWMPVLHCLRPETDGGPNAKQ